MLKLLVRLDFKKEAILMKVIKAKAVIFDMDGVIVDSEPNIMEAKQNVLHKYGVYKPLSYHFKFMGMSFRDIWAQTRQELDLPASTEQLMAEYFEEVAQVRAKNGLQSIAGTVEFIKALAQNDFKLALASSSPLADIEEVLTTFGIKELFSAVISGAELAHPKPAPDIFLLAMEKLGVKAAESLVVEDSVNGVKAGLAAGAQLLVFNDPRYNPNRQIEGVNLVTTMTNLKVRPKKISY